MDPITNSKYSDDFQKFVLQSQNVVGLNPQAKIPKPFSIKPPEKTDKSKKEMKKEQQRQKNKDQT